MIIGLEISFDTSTENLFSFVTVKLDEVNIYTPFIKEFQFASPNLSMYKFDHQKQ